MPCSTAWRPNLRQIGSPRLDSLEALPCMPGNSQHRLVERGTAASLQVVEVKYLGPIGLPTDLHSARPAGPAASPPISRPTGASSGPQLNSSASQPLVPAAIRLIASDRACCQTFQLIGIASGPADEFSMEHAAT
eukprot:362592-Chlamydomonas_euryale.AAC.2